MCKYTKKHKCRDPHYEVTINGNSSIYCDEAISQAVENGNVVVVLRHLTKRVPDVACVSTYHDAFIIVYRHCPVCGGNTPRG